MAFDQDIIRTLSNGGSALRKAINGLSPEELKARPIAGRWSTQEVVIHLCDADLAFVDRIKRIIAEDNPVLQAWDEQLFASRLAYDSQSVEDAVRMIELIRAQIGRVLLTLPDEAFERFGTHSVRGRQTLAEVIGYCVWHLDHHLHFIQEKRKALGK